MITLAPHQIEFAKTCKPYTGLWFGTGTGKTLTALNSLKPFDGDILVIAPKTTVHKKQWQYEASVLGMKEPTVISKEKFRTDWKTLKRFGAVVVDEAHHVLGVSPNPIWKNRQRTIATSQLFENLKQYLSRHRPDRLILATATPNSSPMKVWAASVLLGRNWDFNTFRDDFYFLLPMERPRYSPLRTKEAIEKLAGATRLLGHVLKLEDIKDVPPQTYRTETFELTNAQIKALKTLPSRFTGDATLRTKRHQIENGVLYEDVFDPETNRIVRKTERFDNNKIDYIVERSYEFKKMIIFANYTEQVDAIAEALQKEGRNVYTLDSRTKDRKQVCDDAEAAESAYIVAQASVSSEWEFKSCPVVIFASLSNKNLDYIQGCGRVQRYDRVKKNLYIHLVTDYKGAVDKRWYDCIMSGKDFNEALHE